MQKNLGKIFIVVLFIILLFLFFRTDFRFYLSFEFLKSSTTILSSFVSEQFILSSFIFLILYTLVVSFSIPGSTVLTLAAGFLFNFWGLILVLLSATIGAMINFYLARFLFGQSLQKKYSKKLEKFNKDLKTNATSYLLSLRLIPVFPFFLLNILSGLTKIKPWTFFWTTFIGIIPGSAIYVFAGTQLGSINSTSDILSPGLILALTALGLLALSPTIFKKLKPKNE
jgi:uncharacterized membrane protein YdjX (TVP38/TMEM64 family)